MILPTQLLSLTLLLLPSVFSAPLDPRQDGSSAFASGASAVAALINGLSILSTSTSTASPTPSSGAGTGSNLTNVAYTTCGGTNVSDVTISPCEGGDGTAGNAFVFTVGRNYTISLTYTSLTTISTPRAGLASFSGNISTAYSGQSFNACGYTPCPIQAGVEMKYTYPFRTLRAPSFERLLFNATDGIYGPSFMCASIPVSFSSG